MVLISSPWGGIPVLGCASLLCWALVLFSCSGIVSYKGSWLGSAFNLVLLVNPHLTLPQKHLEGKRALPQEADGAVFVSVLLSLQSTQEEVSSEEEDEEMPEVSAASLYEEVHRRAEWREMPTERCEGTGIVSGRSSWSLDREENHRITDSVWLRGSIVLSVLLLGSQVLSPGWERCVHKPQRTAAAERRSRGLQRHTAELRVKPLRQLLSRLMLLWSRA